MKRLILAVALMAATPVAVMAAAKPYAGHDLAKSAHITIEQAQVMALKARPGPAR
jgi:ABC-type enterobactin transport system permease subunit